jgi:phage terminase large subunit GpA-like protein
MTPDEWGAANRTYPPSAAIPGPRDPYLTPYMTEPARLVAACASKRVVIVAAAQSGKTETFLDIAGQRLDQQPAPILYVGPNKQFLTEQFEPRVMALLDEAPTLAGKLARGKRMTKTRKVIAGVPFRLAHAGSSAALKSDPAALALVDEYDEMLANIKGQGDPLGLVERRGDTYPDFVCGVVSTCRRGMVSTIVDEGSGLVFWDVAPTEDIESPIWRLWQAGTRHHWAWPCPHCGEYFVPRFSCVRYPDGVKPIEAAAGTFVECPRCGGVIEEAHKAGMNERGRYVAPGQRVGLDGVVIGDPLVAPTLSFWVSGLASPFVTFGDRVLSYLEAVALGDDAAIQTAINAGFGELYAAGGGAVKEWQQVASRRNPHKQGEMPNGVIKLTCGIDVQGNGFYYDVRGWGARATSWQIESGEIAGHTNEPEVWNDLANLLLGEWGGLPISLALIDSGFRPNKPNEGPVNVVYDFCRRFRRFVRPAKGYARLSAPIMRSRVKVTVPGARAPVALELVRLDTDFWKQRVHERLEWPEDQPGGFLLAADATDDYCKQLVSEVRKVTPSGKPQWVMVSKRNHYLDCAALNEAAGHLLNVQKIPVGTTRAPDGADDEDQPPKPPAAVARAAPVFIAAAAVDAEKKQKPFRSRMSGIAARLNR